MPKRTVKELVAEIERHKTAARIASEERETFRELASDAQAQRIEADRKIAILETDVHNLLGTIRVMADSSREVRIRRSTVRDADIALALPMRNTEK